MHLARDWTEKLKDYTFINNKVRVILNRMVILIKKRFKD